MGQVNSILKRKLKKGDIEDAKLGSFHGKQSKQFNNGGRKRKAFSGKCFECDDIGIALR